MEPTGHLDPDNRRIELDCFHELHADLRTILVVNHKTVVAERPKRVLQLRKGAILGHADQTRMRVA